MNDDRNLTDDMLLPLGHPRWRMSKNEAKRTWAIAAAVLVVVVAFCYLVTVAIRP